MGARDSKYLRAYEFEEECKRLHLKLTYASRTNRKTVLAITGDQFELLRAYCDDIYDVATNNKQVILPVFRKLLRLSNSIASGKKAKVVFKFMPSSKNTPRDYLETLLEQTLPSLQTFLGDFWFRKIAATRPFFFNNALDFVMLEGTTMSVLRPFDSKYRNLPLLPDQTIGDIADSLYIKINYDMVDISKKGWPASLIFFLLLIANHIAGMNLFELQ